MNHAHSSRSQAFTLIELMIVLAVLGMLAFLLIPSLAKAKARAQRIRCTSHLKQIGLSYRQWALDHQEKYPMHVVVTNGGVQELIKAGYFESPFMAMSNELNTPKILWCPAAEQPQSPAPFASLGRSNVNYFIGLDAAETEPQMFLSGDDNWIVDGRPVTRGILEVSTNNTVAYSAARHKLQGNVGLADGSVQGYSSTRLREALRNTGTNINRIAFP